MNMLHPADKILAKPMTLTLAFRPLTALGHTHKRRCNVRTMFI